MASAKVNASECIVYQLQLMGYFHLRELPSTTQCYTFAITQNNLEANALIYVKLIYPVKNDSNSQQSSAGLCGLYQLQKSDDALPDSGLGFAVQTDEPTSLAVRRHVNQSAVATRVGSSPRLLIPFVTWNPEVGETRNTIIASTSGTLGVLFDEFCANQSIKFAAEEIGAWSACQPMTNGSTKNVSLSKGIYKIFAQDHKRYSWFILPGTFVCRNNIDYELVVSTVNASQTELHLIGAPKNESCRVLCIEERCDFLADKVYYDTNLWSISNVSGSGSLRVKYNYRPRSQFCNQSAYSGFALRISNWAPDQVIALTIHEKNSHLTSRELAEPPLLDGRLTSITVCCAAWLSAILTASIFDARRRNHLPQNGSNPHFDATKMEVAESTVLSTEYCSLDLRSDAYGYTILSEQEPQYTSLKPITEAPIYNELVVS